MLLGEGCSVSLQKQLKILQNTPIGSLKFKPYSALDLMQNWDMLFDSIDMKNEDAPCRHNSHVLQQC